MKNDTSNHNVANLRQLALGLINLPNICETFSMRVFCESGRGISFQPYDALLTKVLDSNGDDNEEQDEGCGTIACALGHAPTILNIPACSKYEDWWQYSKRVLGLESNDCYWEWCFAAEWEECDNSPSGAGYRILHMLAHGLPYWWYSDSEDSMFNSTTYDNEYDELIKESIALHKRNLARSGYEYAMQIVEMKNVK